MSDTSGHGTAIALLIGSNSKLKSSIYGLCPTAEYYIAKITDSFGFSNSEYIHRALLFMAEQDVDIINISFGGSEYNEEIRQDCDYLKQQGCFVIAPSGDDGCDEEVLFPADYEAVYSIAAQDKNGDVFQTANSKSMNGTSNILAPGYEIPCLTYGLTGEKILKEVDGSSVACAIFSGYLALSLANNGKVETVHSLDQLIDSSSIYDNGFINFF